ncbi:hypothetical protein AVEN_152938-1 [Araneus ventricosus]|uniref:Uncharacterized protein n=1 Tax=Araneus ventricosus TaxID=182803 RepID=A0A4Y2ADE8_ARAVE|nr:hypothetical protein AVEN_152938-1 [Araneus ventricosus]
MTASAIASNTEAGAPTANHLATVRPLPKEMRTITGAGTQSPTNTIPTGEANSCLLIRQQLISVFSQCLIQMVPKDIFIYVSIKSPPYHVYPQISRSSTSKIEKQEFLLLVNWYKKEGIQ